MHKNIDLLFAFDLMKPGRGQKHPIQKVVDSRVVLLRSKYKGCCY